MSTFEWFLLVVVVILVPLVVAVVITLWTLEQARQRKRQNRPGSEVPVKRQAVQTSGDAAPDPSPMPTIDDSEPVRSQEDAVALETRPTPAVEEPEATSAASHDVSRETS